MGLIIKATISRGPHHFPHDFRMASFQLHWLLSKVDVIAQRAAIGKQIPEVSAALEEMPKTRMDGWFVDDVVGKMGKLCRKWLETQKIMIFLDHLIEEKVAA